MATRNRERLLLVVAILCLAGLAGDRLILTPCLHFWKYRAEEITLLNKTLSRGHLLLTREREIRERWQEMQHDALSEDASQAENQVLKSVDRWVSASRINLVSLKQLWKNHEEYYNTLECRASAQGGISEVSRFLYELEIDPLCLKIENVAITSRDDGGQSLAIDVTFSGVQFVKKEDLS